MTAELIAQAQTGDGEAFRQVTDPYRRELLAHCYRMLGSFADAEDALQETMLAAWQGLTGFQQRSSVRAWLYRIATNRCLNALRSARRRPPTGSLPPVQLPEPTGVAEVTWLEPYPDDQLVDPAPGPAARYESKEAISLAFMTAMQRLPARQRAVLLLRDVLAFPASDVADMLDSSEQSVTSALKRARASLLLPHEPQASAEVAAAVLARFTNALADGDPAALIALLTDDVRLAMPPLSLEYTGRELARRFHTTVTFRENRRYRAIPARANGQPAFGLYVIGTGEANGLMVLTLVAEGIAAMTRFDNHVLPLFGLPLTLPDA